MTTLNLTTYRDAVRHCLDFMGGDVRTNNERYAKTAVLNAYREFASAARWTYYYRRARLNTVASYNTGSVAYTNATRQLTLTGGTWPSWAAYGVVVIANISYEVASRTSDSVIVLSVNVNPGADLAAGTAYMLYRETYPLPIDFVGADELVGALNNLYPEFVHPSEWLKFQRLQKIASLPRYYCFQGDPHYQGAMAVSFYPAPDAVYAYDMMYQRRPRPIVQYDVSAGTATGSSGSASISGIGTNWDSSLVGSVIRFSANATDTPEGLAWSTPYSRERIVTAVASTTALTVDNTLDLTLSGVKYTISDPVDIEPGAMLDAFFRCCEKHVSLTKSQKDRAIVDQAYRSALILARECDSRFFGDRVAGAGRRVFDIVRGTAAGADVS